MKQAGYAPGYVSVARHCSEMPDKAAVEAAIAKCSTLTPAEARTFLTEGWVLIKGAFPRGLAAEIVAESWRELIEDYGIDRNDPRTWEGHPYVRTGDQPHVHIMAERGDKAAQAQLAASRPPKLCDVAPRALGAILDVVAGNVKDAHALELPRSLAVNLSIKNSSKNKDGAPGWQPPNAESPGWHKDGWQYRHFLDSPEQGLLLGYFYDEVLPESGGTQIVPDSIPTVARFLAQHPEGIHPDIAQGAVLNPLLQAELGTGGRFAELTGEAGDLAIMHPCTYCMSTCPTGTAIRSYMVCDAVWCWWGQT